MLPKLLAGLLACSEYQHDRWQNWICDKRVVTEGPA